MKPRAARPKPDDPEQSRRFIDAAKEAGVDETGQEFEKAFKKLAPERRSRRASNGSRGTP